ncbi:polyprenyl synthetase family protein [Spirillospora sp. NPDC029432]|uniref:polyprenyl synthetase family protein n=1 Tax=Spirillospora sp. NPDC029432 TaxID=3154599 RepID=UPI0034562A4D
MIIDSAPRTPPDPAAIGTAVDQVIHDFLDEHQHAAPDLPELPLFIGMLRDMLAAGGKRIRPRLCVAGWYAVADLPPPPAVFRAAAALELFHTAALIHDDVMDNSDTRRGRRTAQRALAARHRAHPDADALGTSAAILLGDLALGWSYEILQAPDVTPGQLARLWPVFGLLHTETLVGQYLDVASARNPDADTGTAWRIIRYKTAKYTIEHPLRIGAVLAGGTASQLRALSACAMPLGEAFQLRDDLLSVYGDPAATGKSRLDDLREGKHTVLYAIARERATEPQRRRLHRLFGDPRLTDDQAEQIRDVLTATGARAAVERLIADRAALALAAQAAAGLRPTGALWLRDLTRMATDRTC